MSIQGSANSKDIIIPKGIVIAYPITGSTVSDEGIDLGYCQEAEFSITEESRQVYSARDNTKALAVDKVTKTDYAIPLQIMSVNPENLAMLFRGNTGNQVQVVGTYDALAPLAVNAPSVLDRTIRVGKRAVSVTKIPYDGGSAICTVGSQLSTGASTAEIVWVDGDATAGNLYVVGLTGADFIDNAALVDDGGVPGACVQNGAVIVMKDIVLTDSGGTTRYMLGADYDIDEKSGTLFVKSTGSITAAEAMEASFDFPALTEVTVNAGAVAPDAYRIEVLPFSDESENRYEMTFWKCTVKSDTTIKMVTAGDEETMLDINLTPLTNGPGATSDSPVFKQVLV